LYNNGPVEAYFKVYEDFFSYKSGVYTRQSGLKGGALGVKMLGWGFDEASGLNYWLCANSWGIGWGELGFFKIAMG
jgi:cathepsin B